MHGFTAFVVWPSEVGKLLVRFGLHPCGPFLVTSKFCLFRLRFVCFGLHGAWFFFVATLLFLLRIEGLCAWQSFSWLKLVGLGFYERWKLGVSEIICST